MKDTDKIALEASVRDEMALTLTYAACPNASYNVRHYEKKAECGWCNRRRRMLEHLMGVKTDEDD